MAAKITEFMRDRAYLASIELARERGTFAMFNKDLYLSGGNFASRLPNDIKERIRQHGIRNSHLLAIAPTGTISLAFADNASNGIEPPFSWTYTRKKRRLRQPRGIRAGHAWSLYRTFRRGCAAARLFRHPRRSRAAHQGWWPAGRALHRHQHPTTVNVAEDYPYGDSRISTAGVDSAEGPRDLSAELGLALCSDGQRQGAAEVVGEGPTAARVRPCRSRCSRAALAGTHEIPEATAWTYMSIRPRRSRSSWGVEEAAVLPSSLGNGDEQARGLGAVPRRSRWTARQHRAWLKMKLDVSPIPWAMIFEMRSRRTARSARDRLVSAVARSYAIARAPARLRSRRRPPVSTTCQRGRAAAPAPTARSRGRLDVANPASGDELCWIEGDPAARRDHAPVLDLLSGHIRARATDHRHPLARHARGRSGVDRHEAPEAPRLLRAVGDFMEFIRASAASRTGLPRSNTSRGW